MPHKEIQTWNPLLDFPLYRLIFQMFQKIPLVLLAILMPHRNIQAKAGILF
jgi:hypothetical protein